MDRAIAGGDTATPLRALDDLSNIDNRDLQRAPNKFLTLTVYDMSASAALRCGATRQTPDGLRHERPLQR